MDISTTTYDNNGICNLVIYVYVSMPISGYDISERCATASSLKTYIPTLVRNSSHKYNDADIRVITPFDCAPYDPNRSYGDCMKLCLKNMLNCDIVYLDATDDYTQSKGCRVEIDVANACGIPVVEFDLPDMQKH